MPNYRRSAVAGGTYFFTVNLHDRTCNLLTTHIQTLKSAIRQAHQHQPFQIDAWVVLPDHMHCVWTLPNNDTDYMSRWRRIKSLFSRRLKSDGLLPGYQTVWQRRYWEHTIRDDTDFKAHMDYVHINPVKHGWVQKVADWPYSTFHRYVQAGTYSCDWAGGEETQIVTPVGE